MSYLPEKDFEYIQKCIKKQEISDYDGAHFMIVEQDQVKQLVYRYESLARYKVNRLDVEKTKSFHYGLYVEEVGFCRVFTSRFFKFLYYLARCSVVAAVTIIFYLIKPF